VDVDNQGGRWKKKKDGAKIQKVSIFKIRPCYSKLKVIYVFGYIKKNFVLFRNFMMNAQLLI